MKGTTPRKVLVIANETIEGEALHDVIVAQRDVEILVVAPAFGLPVAHIVVDQVAAPALLVAA